MPAVKEIRTYPFNEAGLEEVRASRYGKNWIEELKAVMYMRAIQI